MESCLWRWSPPGDSSVGADPVGDVGGGTGGGTGGGGSGSAAAMEEVILLADADMTLGSLQTEGTEGEATRAMVSIATGDNAAIDDGDDEDDADPPINFFNG